jgi:ABC-type spermidine/putrescine transport system permease subunit II
VGVSSAVISTAIGTITAIVLVRNNFWGKQTFSTLILAPLILPEVVLAVALLVFLVFLKINLSYFTIIVGHILLSLPRSTLIIRASASGMDISLEEAAADLGANAWFVFSRVTFPLLVPGILASLLLTFTLSFDNFVITMFVGGVGTTTLPLQIFSMMRFGTDPQINALGTILIVANLILVFAIGGTQLQKVMGGGMQK